MTLPNPHTKFIKKNELIKLLVIVGKERRLAERRDGKPLPIFGGFL